MTERTIDWLYLAKLHYAQYAKRGDTERGSKFHRWSWMALLLWAEGDE